MGEPLELADGDWYMLIPRGPGPSQAEQTLAREGRLLPFPPPTAITWRAGDDERLRRNAMRLGIDPGHIGLPGSYAEHDDDRVLLQVAGVIAAALDRIEQSLSRLEKAVSSLTATP